MLSELRTILRSGRAGLAVVLAVLAGCTPERDQSEFFSPDLVDVLVVDAVLVVGEPLPGLRLSRTLAPDVPYTWQASGEVGATVVISDDEGNEVPYAGAFGTSGIYLPDDWFSPLVRASTLYELRVETDRGEILTASTMTPAHFGVERWVALDPVTGAELRELRTFADSGDAVFDEPENQIPYASVIVEAQVGEVAEDGFQLALFSLDPDSDYVIDPPFFDDEDFVDLERTGSSPALAADNGNVRLPWFAIYYEGRHTYKVFAVDRNWFDLLRSTPETPGGGGFGGTLGDGFETPIFHVNGGIGLFGSASVDSTGFRVLQAP